MIENEVANFISSFVGKITIQVWMPFDMYGSTNRGASAENLNLDRGTKFSIRVATVIKRKNAYITAP